MTTRLRHSSAAVIRAILALTFLGTAHAADEAALMKQLTIAIAKVREISGLSIARTNAAEHVARLTKKVSSGRIDDKTVADLLALLDIPDDSVRFWVATALGNLGTRAKSAVPKLEDTLPQADCRVP